MKKFKVSLVEIDMMVGNPKYFDIPVGKSKREVFPREEESMSAIVAGTSTSMIKVSE